MFMFLVLSLAVIIFGALSNRYYKNIKFVIHSSGVMYTLCLSILVLSSSTDLKMAAFVTLLFTIAYNALCLREFLKSKNKNH